MGVERYSRERDREGGERENKPKQTKILADRTVRIQTGKQQ